MKPSEYPISTIIELPQWGLYRRRIDHWSRIDGYGGWDDANETSSLKTIDERQENGLPIIIRYVPWGLTETLVDMCYDFWLDNGYKVPEGDNPFDKILKAAIENWDERGEKEDDT